MCLCLRCFSFSLGSSLFACFVSEKQSRFGVKKSLSGELGTSLSLFGTRPCSASARAEELTYVMSDCSVIVMW